jgi:hypothetical protein
LGNSGDEVVTTGFNGLATKKTVNGVAYSIYTHSDANTGANIAQYFKNIGASRGV